MIGAPKRRVRCSRLHELIAVQLRPTGRKWLVPEKEARALNVKNRNNGARLSHCCCSIPVRRATGLPTSLADVPGGVIEKA